MSSEHISLISISPIYSGHVNKHANSLARWPLSEHGGNFHFLPSSDVTIQLCPEVCATFISLGIKHLADRPFSVLAR